MLFNVLLGVSVLVNLFLVHRLLKWKFTAFDIHNKFAPRLDTALYMLLEVTGKEKKECVMAIETICRMPADLQRQAVEEFVSLKDKARSRIGFF